MNQIIDPPDLGASQHQRYQMAIERHGSDLARFAMGYERDPARRQELLQEIHVAIWQSFAGFKEQCSLRTWVYRVAHNIGVSHIQRSIKRVDRDCIDLDDAQLVADPAASIENTERRIDMDRLLALIHRLAPFDREVMLLYLEDLDAASIGEIIGISAGNVATKVHRLKALLAKQIHEGSAKA
jgi:RNA polymerase sigma-70 factor (ECF subfamily)